MTTWSGDRVAPGRGTAAEGRLGASGTYRTTEPARKSRARGTVGDSRESGRQSSEERQVPVRQGASAVVGRDVGLGLPAHGGALLRGEVAGAQDGVGDALGVARRRDE